MNLHEIARRVKANLQGDTFCLSNLTTTETEDVSRLLKEACGTESVQMKQVVYTYEQSLVLHGIIVLAEQPQVKLRVEFTQTVPSDILFHIDIVMPDNWRMPLDETGILFLRCVHRRFETHLGTDTMEGSINGELPLGELVFPASGSYNSEGHTWDVVFEKKSTWKAKQLVAAVSDKAKLGLPVELLPDISIKDLMFEYSGRAEGPWDRLLLDITTEAGLHITKDLGLEDVGVVIQKRKASWSYTLKGNVRIASTILPARLHFHGQLFEMGVDTGEKGCLLPSLSDIGRIMGVDNLTAVMPAAIADRKSLKLMNLTAVMSPVLGSLVRFDVGIATAEPWNFFGFSQLVLDNLYVGFSRGPGEEKSKVSFIIIGIIKIVNFRIQLGALYSSENGWIFRGLFPPGKKVDLADTACALAKMLDMDMQKLPIPAVELKDVSVTFGMTDKHFSAAASTTGIHQASKSGILDSLFNIEAAIKIDSKVEKGVRSYRGEFKGRLNIGDSVFTVEFYFDSKTKANVVKGAWAPERPEEALTLIQILKEFGVQEVPQVLETLDMGLLSVSMEYKIDKKELNIEVKTSHFERVSLVVSDKNYEVEVRLKDKLTLSKLPIVGTNLHLLDSLAIEELRLLASSKDHPEMSTLRGAALLGKISDKPFVLQVYHAHSNYGQNNLPQGNPSQTTPYLVGEGSGGDMSKWFAIDKAFGIFELYRLGIGFQDGKVAFMLDASLSAGAVKLSLMGVGLGMCLSAPKEVDFYLSGLGIDFDNGTIILSGAFMKSGEAGKESYDGKLLIKMKGLSVFAVGSYSGDSLLVYALLNMQLGGPPAFFVTGLAAGFGSNLSLEIPPVDKISTFPLVSGALGRTKKADMLAQLKTCIHPQKGKSFFAAGVKATSFKLAESFALLIVILEEQPEICILGLSEISVPPKLPKNTSPMAYAQLALKASFSPKAGLFSIEALLTSESYILSKDCKLTGGFALYFWFSGSHSGDFVITLGGYHPNYVKPKHYPDVPRLGFSWDINKNLKLKGEFYFALTPSAIMGGGRISAVYTTGAVTAWFMVRADFQISWKPFSYEAELFAGLGVSVKIDFLFIHTTISLELSVGLHIWGPEFSGTASISLFIISFTISFGDNAQKHPPMLTWKEFAESFLLEGATRRGRGKRGEKRSAAPTTPISIAVSGGQRGEKTVNEKSCPVVWADGLELLVKSSIPFTGLSLNGQSVRLKPNLPEIGVWPMGEMKKLKAVYAVDITDGKGRKIACQCEAVYENIPAAMWRSTQSKEELIFGAATGLRISPTPISYPLFPPKNFIDLDKLSAYSCIERKFYWNPIWEMPDYPQKDPIETLSATIMNGTVAGRRKQLLAELAAEGFSLPTNINLTGLAAEADSLFSEEMILGVLS